MQSTSRQSLASLREALDEGPAGQEGLADGLWAVVDLLDTQPSLRRALSDPAARPDAKAELAERLFGDKLPDAVVRLVATAARQRWAAQGDLGDALDEVAATAVLARAEADDALSDVEDELFRFGRIVAREPGLRSALADRTLPAENRTSLVRALLEDRARPETTTLLERAAGTPRSTSLESAVEDLVALAARRRDRFVAVVRVPLPLTDEQSSRLVSVLERIYGRGVQLQVDVDPRVQGGGSVRVGDEVVDGSVAHRLSEAATNLGGRR